MDNSGPAFPQRTTSRYLGSPDDEWPGITKREWFAGMAMVDCPLDPHNHEAYAKWCCDRADALLAALKEEPK